MLRILIHRGSFFLAVLFLVSPSLGIPGFARAQGPHDSFRDFQASPRQMAQFHLARKEYDRALELYQSLLEQGENDSYVFRGLVQAYQGQGALPEAATFLESYRKKHPQLSEVLYGLGYVHYLEGNHSKAQDYFQNAVERNPRNALAWNNWGASLLHTKSYTSALKKVKEAIRLEPRNPLFYNNLRYIYAESGQIGLFFAEFQRYVKEGSKLLAEGYGKAQARALRQESFRLYQKGQLDGAIQKFQEIEEIYRTIDYEPGLVPVYFSLGLLFEEKQDVDRAREYYEMVLEINPHHLQARKKVRSPKKP